MTKTIETIALTEALVALVDRIEPDPGPEPGRHDPTDAEFDEMAEAVLSGAPKRRPLAVRLWLADLEARARASSKHRHATGALAGTAAFCLRAHPLARHPRNARADDGARSRRLLRRASPTGCPRATATSRLVRC